ncbi:MAG: ABC transporter ATP-binding protein [Acidobacteria bacterium]|nr:ABC transporter ATP-binding protein [Acidobacteriota bacterium]
MLELRKATRVYGAARSVTALDSVDLTIPTGAMLAVMGPSGSGKSTLLNLLGGLDRPTSGQVLLDGVDLAALDEEARTRVRRDRIGIVFQFFNLLPSLSAAENVALPLLLAGSTRAQAEARGRDALALVGLALRDDHLPDALSGGEKQRVAIARAVVTRPSLLLADEPTGNLDSATGEEILTVIRKIHREMGTTVVVVTHDDRIAAHCDGVIRLRDGRVETAPVTATAAGR